MKSIFPKSCGVKQGDRFGRLVVVGMPFKVRVKCSEQAIGSRVRSYCVCKCDCGKSCCPSAIELQHKKTVSCGCYRREACLAATTTHGLTDVGPYFVWKGIKTRCYKPTFRQFKDYGGRGITVCDEWRNDYKAFYDWAMANGYEKGLEIDRIDNNGNYEPGNCQFVPDLVNQRNKRTIVARTAFGETKPLYQWLDDPRCQVSERSIRSRLQRGWEFERAMSEPVEFTPRWHGKDGAA